jgi:hypothetical protein
MCMYVSRIAATSDTTEQCTLSWAHKCSLCAQDNVNCTAVTPVAAISDTYMHMHACAHSVTVLCVTQLVWPAELQPASLHSCADYPGHTRRGLFAQDNVNSSAVTLMTAIWDPICCIVRACICPGQLQQMSLQSKAHCHVHTSVPCAPRNM